MPLIVFFRWFMLKFKACNSGEVRLRVAFRQHSILDTCAPVSCVTLISVASSIRYNMEVIFEDKQWKLS